jgi:hypothetical protein
MGILDFIKKIFSEPEEEKPTENKQVSFSNLEEIIKRKIEETNAKEEKELSIIRKNIKRFTYELTENIKVVNEVDIEAKEKNDKIKSAV